ncbi:TOM1-like protein 2, partial [Blyttiomyces sp. JEL0837]
QTTFPSNNSIGTMSFNLKNLFTKAPTGPIAENIELATSESQQDQDWGFVIATAQLVNANPQEGSAQAVKALKNKLKSKSPIVVNYALSTLDHLVKHCGLPFAAELGTRDNLGFLQRVLIRENLAPENRGRLLEMIGDWAEHIENPPSFRLFFHQLVSQGFRFPAAYNVPIQTIPFVAATFWNPVAGGQPTTAPPEIAIDTLPLEERTKWVDFDCNLAENNIAMLIESLSYADRSEDLNKNELVQEFKQKCLDMRARIVRLIEKVVDEDLLTKLIKANGDLNSALEKYENALVGIFPTETIPQPDMEFELSVAAATKASVQEANGAVPTGNLISVGDGAAATTSSISDEMKPYLIGTADDKGKGKGVNIFDDAEVVDDSDAAGPSNIQFIEEDEPAFPSEKKLGKLRADPFADDA